MRSAVLLLAILCCGSATAGPTYTWRLIYHAPPKGVSSANFQKGIKDGLTMWSRYYDVNFLQRSSGAANIYVVIPPWTTGAYAYADPGGSIFGPRLYGGRVPTICFDPTRNMVSANVVRKAMAHELGHFIARLGHTNGSDIMNTMLLSETSQQNWSHTDWSRIVRVYRARPGVPLPWNDVAWWAPAPPPPPPAPKPTYQWTNPNKAADVSGDGKITALDSLRVINAISRRIAYDQHVKPASYFDVNADKAVTSADALAVIAAINRGGR